VPAGFGVEAVADNLLALTQIEFTPDGDMLVSLQGGRIWWYRDTNGDGHYDERTLYAHGFEEVVGLLYDPTDGAVWVGGRGKLYRTLDADGDGVGEVRELRVEGLPWGRHQNNGLEWNPDPDPFTGEPGRHWIYFGLGSTDDLVVGGDLNATVLRFPRDGQGQQALEVVSQGNRNAYDVLWAPVPVDLAQLEGATNWQLFASENGPDFNDAPDEVNHIRWGLDYGFPDHFGAVTPPAVEGDPYSGPIVDAGAHTSANGLAYITNPAWPAEYRTLYVSLFGEVFSPIPVGHTVERISLREETLADGSVTYRGERSDFVTGMDRPLPLAVGPDGNVIAGDYATGVIYRIAYAGE
jgi:glucose/arabinose dehydrogenase